MAATLWNNFSFSPVRRLSSSSISSGVSRHFAVQRNSTDLACFGPTHVVGSKSHHNLRIGQSQSLQGARDMQLVWFVLDSPLSQCQCSGQEADCPRLCRLRTQLTVRDFDDPGPREKALLNSCMHLATNSAHAFAPHVGPL